MRTSLFPILICAVTLYAGVAAAEAWNRYCITDMESEETLCTTELSARHGGAEFVFYFAHTAEGAPPFVAAGPERLFSNMTIKVDEEVALAADRCEIGLCYFEVEKSGILLEQFKQGTRAHIVIEESRRAISFDGSITLVGFSSAFSQN